MKVRLLSDRATLDTCIVSESRYLCESGALVRPEREHRGCRNTSGLIYNGGTVTGHGRENAFTMHSRTAPGRDWNAGASPCVRPFEKREIIRLPCIYIRNAVSTMLELIANRRPTVRSLTIHANLDVDNEWNLNRNLFYPVNIVNFTLKFLYILCTLREPVRKVLKLTVSGK